MTDTPSNQRLGMKRALIWSNILNEPLFTMYGLLMVIMRKFLGASALEIVLLTTLKPAVTVLSFYWSAGLKGRSSKLKPNVIWAGIWMRAPFLLTPCFDSVWFIIFAAVNYMFFSRASSPAWLEMIKRNLGDDKRSRAFSLSSALAYCEGIILSIAIGAVLDSNPSLWKWLLSGSACIGLGSVIVQGSVPIKIEPDNSEKVPFKELVIRPWRDSYRLIRDNAGFARFQWGFMICGFGIMLIMPILPVFMVDTLGISFLEVATAISIAKGLGFAVSSPIWSQWMQKFHISWVASIVFLTVGFFPLLLTLSTWHLAWLYIAFFSYGVGQGGSHLVWNLSGPVFAGSEDSSRYTGVGVVLAGLRGIIAPSIGGLLFGFYGSSGVLLLGGILCFYSGFFLLRDQLAIFKKAE
jgi:MFS family permease